jgi:hypothetical protein
LDEFGPGGGSLALAELIDEHGSAVAADFQAHYGLRLSDVLFEQSPREVLALVEGLVAYEDSLYVAHDLGGDRWPEFLGWGKTRHMLADHWDAMYAIAVGAAGSKKKPPTYPRPNVKKPSAGTPLFAMRPPRPKGD